MQGSGAELATGSRSSSLGEGGGSGEDAVLSDATNVLPGQADLHRRKHAHELDAMKASPEGPYL